MIQRSCKQCGKPFMVEAAQLRHEGYGRFCTRACVRVSLRKAVRVPRINCGRVMIYAPQNPMAGKDGYAYRYRLVVSEKIGRPLLRTEVVHHLNGDPSDDRPENLTLAGGHGEHRRMHALVEARRRGYDLLTQKRCQICKAVKLLSEFSPTVSKGRRVRSGMCRPCAATYQRKRRKEIHV